MALDGNGKLIEEQTSSGRPYVGIDKDVNARRSTPAGKKGHSTVNASATTTEQSWSFDVDWLVYLINDGETDITFNFDTGTTSAGNFVIKPGEAVGDIPRKATTLFAKASSGSQPFRAMGVK